MATAVENIEYTTRPTDDGEYLEVRNAAGRIIAYVLPGHELEIPRILSSRPKITTEEIQRRKQLNKKGMTTKEVLAYLESLEPN